MKHLLATLWTELTRTMFSAEPILIATVSLLGTLVGVHDTMGGEMTSLGNSYYQVNQPYIYEGLRGSMVPVGDPFRAAGSRPVDVRWERRPTPSSDLPPSSVRGFSYYGWPSFSPPILKMPAGPLQVW